MILEDSNFDNENNSFIDSENILDIFIHKKSSDFLETDDLDHHVTNIVYNGFGFNSTDKISINQELEYIYIYIYQHNWKFPFLILKKVMMYVK